MTASMRRSPCHDGDQRGQGSRSAPDLRRWPSGAASTATRCAPRVSAITPAGSGRISTGQDIVVNVAIKPTSSIAQPRRSVNLRVSGGGGDRVGATIPVGIRATPIAEAMLALVLIDHALRHRVEVR